MKKLKETLRPALQIYTPCLPTRRSDPSFARQTYVVSLNKVPSKHLSSSDTTVIRTLRTWETHLWPSENLSIGIEKSVLLLKTEPWFVFLGSVH